MNYMETIVAWTYVAGFSLPLLGSIVVLIRSIVSLTRSGGDVGSRPSLIKAKPLSTILVILGFTFLILLALLLVIFFIYKFTVFGYSFPLSLDIAGFIIFFLYLTGSGSLFFYITSPLEGVGSRKASLSRALVDLVTEKVMGSSSSDSG